MKRHISLLSTIFLLLLPELALAQATETTKEETAIRQVIQYYLDGRKNNNAESLKKAIHPKAKIFSLPVVHRTGKGDLSEISGELYVKYRSAERPKWPRPFVQKIVSIDVTGNTAAVKIELFWPDAWWGEGKISLREPAPGVTDTEYLSLMKFDEGWKIVGQVSTTREGK
jgi:hypothetical protein